MERQERQEKAFTEVSDVLMRVASDGPDGKTGPLSMVDTMLGGSMALATMIAAMREADTDPELVRRAAEDGAKYMTRIINLQPGELLESTIEEQMMDGWLEEGDKSTCEYWVAKILQPLRGELEHPEHAAALITALLCHVCSLAGAMGSDHEKDKAGLLFEEITASINHHYPNIQIRLEHPPI